MNLYVNATPARDKFRDVGCKTMFSNGRWFYPQENTPFNRAIVGDHRREFCATEFIRQYNKTTIPYEFDIVGIDMERYASFAGPMTCWFADQAVRAIRYVQQAFPECRVGMYGHLPYAGVRGGLNTVARAAERGVQKFVDRLAEHTNKVRTIMRPIIDAVDVAMPSLYMPNNSTGTFKYFGPKLRYCKMLADEFELDFVPYLNVNRVQRDPNTGAWVGPYIGDDYLDQMLTACASVEVDGAFLFGLSRAPESALKVISRWTS